MNCSKCKQVWHGSQVWRRQVEYDVAVFDKPLCRPCAEAEDQSLERMTLAKPYIPDSELPELIHSASQHQLGTADTLYWEEYLLRSGIRRF